MTDTTPGGMRELKIHYLEAGSGELSHCGDDGGVVGVVTSGKIEFTTCLRCLQLVALVYPPHPFAFVAARRIGELEEQGAFK